jgi:hypothetical protein
MERKGKMLLDEAKAVIDARGDHYGPPIENWTRIAKLWTAYMSHKLKDGEEITALDHGLMMDLVKTARLIETPNHWDSYLDKAGYAAASVECFSVD